MMVTKARRHAQGVKVSLQRVESSFCGASEIPMADFRRATQLSVDAR